MNKNVFYTGKKKSQEKHNSCSFVINKSHNTSHHCTVSLHNSDSIKLIYKNNDEAGLQTIISVICFPYIFVGKQATEKKSN